MVTECLKCYPTMKLRCGMVIQSFIKKLKETLKTPDDAYIGYFIEIDLTIVII